jgi:hypothetical protein
MRYSPPGIQTMFLAGASRGASTFAIPEILAGHGVSAQAASRFTVT